MHDTPYTRNVRELSSALRLPEAAQDWAIIVADPMRVAEFCRFLDSRPDIDPLGRSLLLELILASLNEAMELDIAPAALLDQCETVLRHHAPDHPSTVSYWAGLQATKTDPFPVAGWMRRVLDDSKGREKRLC